MKRIKRLILLTVVAALLSTTLGAAAAQDDQITLNLWMFLDGSGFLPSVVEAFEAANPNIDIQITDIPEDEYTTKIETAILAGEPPDIGFPYNARWIKAGYVLPIDDALAAAGVDLDDYNAGAVSRNCVMDDMVYCLGSYTGGTVLFYNKDMFDAAGIPYPSATEAMSVEEYASIAEQLSVPSDNIEQRVWGGAAPAPWWMEVQNYFSDDGRTATGYFNDEATAHFFDTVVEMYDSGSVLTSSDTSLVSPDDLLVSGQLAMTVGDTVTLQPLLENADINWGAAPPPVEQAGDPAWVYTGSDELMAFSGSDHPAEAIQFVIFWGTEGNRLRAEAGGLPLNMRLAEELNWAGASEGRQEMLAAVQTARPTVFIPEWYFVFGPLEEAFNLMIEDGLSAQDALDEMEPVVQDDLDQLWETWESIVRN